ncbi:uncharacterized protein LOC132303534 [Cornus florida]|uniref:uncharacterized protein LOC132303534 n=1 Tax=Cornus florida TaxID=4283 RepID=UPI0028991E89|nr:uncharacterized protein LOC132303534 [Cornus florida]
MAFYVEEEDVWKCPKHPSKRRRSGICPTCLRERLVTLCPDCANVRPCACCPTDTTSSSSSSSSSFSLFSSTRGVGSVGRVSNLIDSEPSFRRSSSVGMFFRSRFAGGERDAGGAKPPLARNPTKSSAFWSVFKTRNSSKKGGEGVGEEDEESLKKSRIIVEEEEEDDYSRMMRRSRSVSVPISSNSGTGNVRSSSKGRKWHFPSPMKVFRQTKLSKVVQERSPLYRG